MIKNIPTASQIASDVEERLEILVKIKNDKPLTDEDWEKIVYYKPFHDDHRSDFIQSMKRIRKGLPAEDSTSRLSPHARWLLSVYGGEELTAKECSNGSIYHRRVLDMLGSSFSPTRIIKQIRGLDKELASIKDNNPNLDAQVIDNIAIDETFEKLGRNL